MKYHIILFVNNMTILLHLPAGRQAKSFHRVAIFVVVSLLKNQPWELQEKTKEKV